MSTNSTAKLNAHLQKWMEETTPERVQSNIVHFALSALSAPKCLDEIANTSNMDFFHDLEHLYQLMDEIRHQI